MLFSSRMIAIFGLGNPGKEYERTRHNAGFLVADELARRAGASWRDKKAWQAQMAEGELDGKRVLVVKPQTFMNLSGEAVHAVFAHTQAAPAASLVVFDEADLPFGAVRFRTDGSAGGHNGMKSILEALPKGTAIARVRVGIGRPADGRIPMEDWVLGKWTADEKKTLDDAVRRAADEAERWMKNLKERGAKD